MSNTEKSITEILAPMNQSIGQYVHDQVSRAYREGHEAGFREGVKKEREAKKKQKSETMKLAERIQKKIKRIQVLETAIKNYCRETGKGSEDEAIDWFIDENKTPKLDRRGE